MDKNKILLWWWKHIHREMTFKNNELGIRWSRLKNMKIPLQFKVYFSPFKRPKLSFYFGKIALGLPYYLPRYWRKRTAKEAFEATVKVFNKPGNTKNFAEEYESQKQYLTAVPLKFGFSYNNLGWKTKYDSFRFEYAPRYSFVVLGYQFCLTFYAENEDAYWESYLAYEYDTDKSKSPQERLKEAKSKHPQVWTDGDGFTIDYWEKVIKSKYI